MEMKDRIVSIIEARKIKRSEFAREIHVSPASVTQMCTGVINPSNQTIDLICTKFRVNEKWLRTGEGDMDINDTEKERLENFFADVLSTAPDERSALIAALGTLPKDFWGMVADLAEAYTANLSQLPNKEKED